MIDRRVFTREFTVLLERFGRAGDASEILIQRYLQFLDSELDTAEFEFAAREIFNRDQFWPSPLRFVEAARGNPTQLAGSEWDQLMIALKDNPAELPVTDRGRAALKAIGGFRALMEATDYSLEGLRKRFLGAYQDVERPRVSTPVLPEATALVEAAGD